MITKENVAEYAPLVQALADGKTIQRLSSDNVWVDLTHVTFKYPPNYYRVKPEPFAYYANVFKGTGGKEYLGSVMFPSRDLAENDGSGRLGYARTARMQEVEE